ncbi:MAG: SGNH/GDSL hydrolase family protein [Oscillatoria princeps RMCB-10]|nr:SGNH/GDSL hydrolase family protein [Oscillatoria princeps RMCB-10]
MVPASAAFALATILGVSSGASAQKIDEIYVFGDSLSDVGKVFEATQGKNPPNPPYFPGRYSNGPVWVDYLASQLKLTSNPGTNFAVGGATTGNFKKDIPGLLAQIERFKATRSSADPDALYLIWAGANDYLGGGTDPAAPVSNLTLAVQSLEALGAKNIAVVNLPDLGKLPETRTSERSASLTYVSREHNSRLATAISNLRQNISPDIKIAYLDANSIFNQVLKAPEKFGFKNVTQPCLSPGSICDNPNEYFFWDGIHPTTAAHKLFVELTFSALQAGSETPALSAFDFTVPLGVFVFGALGTAGLIVRGKKPNK